MWNLGHTYKKASDYLRNEELKKLMNILRENDEIEIEFLLTDYEIQWTP